jgi:hypothetical protein
MLDVGRAGTRILLAAAIMFAPAAIMFAPAASAESPAAPRSIAGDWQGDFGAGTWLFNFTRTGTGWTGKYKHQKFNGWNPLQKLVATNTSAKFAIDADVTVDFNLKLAQPGSMRGTVRFGPTSSPRQDALVLPLELKRTNS